MTVENKGTDQNQEQSQEQSQVVDNSKGDEFADAFALADVEEPAEKKVEPQKKEETVADTTQDGKKKEEDKKPDASAQKTQAETSPKDDDATYKKRWESLNGILTNAQENFTKEKAELKSQLDALTEQVKTLSKTDKKDATAKSEEEEDLTKDQKKALAEY
jgi:hypothetical protein